MVNTKTKLDYSMLLGDWSKLLGHSLLDTSYMDALVDFLERNYSSKVIYPRQPDIFRAFRMTQLKDVRVVIVGQDPYPDGRATGLAFANEDQKALLGGTLSPSLEKIKTCIEDLVYKGLNLNFDPTLTSWADQGVLLLNSSLTVERGAIGGHTKYWNKFMEGVLSELSSYKTGVFYLFLGGQSKRLLKAVNEKNNFVYTYVHPAFSARQNIVWNCPYFNIINKEIQQQNGKEFCIKW